MNPLWVFPGQGGQYAGMLATVPVTLRQHVEQLLGIQLVDTQTGYQDAVQLQVSTALLQVSRVQRLRTAGILPRLVAGHSLGVFAAAYAVGSLAQDDLFQLVKIRASLMQQAYPKGYGMGVIVGLTRAKVAALVQQSYIEQQPVFVSNQNAIDQTAIAGKLEGIDRVLRLAKQVGATKTLHLQVPVPSHSPLMTGVARQLVVAASAYPVNRPSGIYLANYSGHAVRQASKVAADLVSNLVYPVYFEAMMNVAQNYQPELVVSFGPGHPFRQVLRQNFPTIRQIDLNQVPTDDAIYLIDKWKRGAY